MTIVLMLLTTLAAVALLLVLAHFAGSIAQTLEAIGANEPSSSNRGGPRSLLSRIWFGVRAIDHQVAALVPQATRLNENLEQLAGGMVALKVALKSALDAVEKQQR